VIEKTILRFVDGKRFFFILCNPTTVVLRERKEEKKERKNERETERE